MQNQKVAITCALSRLLFFKRFIHLKEFKKKGAQNNWARNLIDFYSLSLAQSLRVSQLHFWIRPARIKFHRHNPHWFSFSLKMLKYKSFCRKRNPVWMSWTKKKHKEKILSPRKTKKRALKTYGWWIRRSFILLVREDQIKSIKDLITRKRWIDRIITRLS